LVEEEEEKKDRRDALG
jgi:hypothetical protein